VLEPLSPLFPVEFPVTLSPLLFDEAAVVADPTPPVPLPEFPLLMALPGTVAVEPPPLPMDGVVIVVVVQFGRPISQGIRDVPMA